MNKDINRVFLLTTLLVVLIGLGAINAADVSDNSTPASTIQDTPSTTTQVANTVSDTAIDDKVDTDNAKSSVMEDTQKNIKVDKETKSANNALTKNVKSASTVYITDDNYNQYFDNGTYNSSVTNVELRSNLYNKNITFNTKIENFNNPSNFTLYNSTVTFKSTEMSITYVNDINIVNTDNRTTSIVCDGQYRFLDFKKIHVYQKNNSTTATVKQVGNYPVYFENSTFDVTSDNAVVFDINNSQSYILFNNITVSTNTTPVVIDNSGIYIAANVINVKESVNKPIIRINNIQGKNNNILANYLISSFATGADTIESINSDNVTIASNMPTADNNITLVNLEITNDILSLDEENIIQVNVTNLVGSKVNTGTVSYKIDDVNISTAKVENGVSTIRYTPTKIGYYTIDIVYNDESGNYTHATTSLVRDSNGTYSLVFHPINSTTKQVLSTYFKKTPTVTVDPVNAFVGGRVNITAHVIYNNTSVNDGRLVFKVNNKTVRDNNNEAIYINVENGLAVLTNFTVPSNWVNGNKTISAVYGGTDMLTGARSKVVLMNLTKPSVSLELQPVTVTSGTTTQLTVKVTDNGNNVNDGRVVFKLNDKSIRGSNGNPVYVQVVGGVASLNFTVPSYYSAKDYKLSCVYAGKLYNRIETTSTLTVTNHNIKSRSISGVSDTNNTLVIDENNYNLYIKHNQWTDVLNDTYESYTVTRQDISNYTEVVLKNIPMTVNDYDIPIGHTLTLINTSISGVGFHNNTTLRGGTLKSTVKIGSDISNVTIDNITANYGNDGWIFYIQSDYFTLKNSRINVTMTSNTINWRYDAEPSTIPLYIGGRSMDPAGNHALIENNNLTVYIKDYAKYDSSDPFGPSTDWPTAYGIYVTGTDATIRNNNIKMTNKEGIPGWLYAIDTTRSNNTIIGNNMTVQAVNYTAGIYMDGWYGAENNYVANNIIHLQAGNASYHEDNNMAENVGYGITLTNGEYIGGSFSGGNYKNCTIINNTIYATGYAIYCIEGFGITDTTIANNTIELNGTAVSGISVIGVRSNITGNDITVNGKDNQTYPTGDYLVEQTTGIALQRGSKNNITNNIITCDNNAGIIINQDSNNYIAYNIVSSANNPYTIYIADDCNNISIINNTLQTNTTEGDSSVRGSTSTVISNQVERLIANIKLETPGFIKLVGDNVTINGSLLDENNNPVKRSSITLTIGDEEPVTLKVESDGTFKYTYTTTQEKDNITIKAAYDGGAFYLPVTNTVFIDVEKLDSYIDIDQTDITTPDNITTINGQLKEQYTNKGLSNQTITIISNNKTYQTATNDNGTFTINITTPNNEGTYNIKASYNGNDKHDSTDITVQYNVEKLGTTIIIDSINQTSVDNIIQITGRVIIDYTNNIITNPNVTININNKTYNTNTTGNGTFTASLQVEQGLNNITITYSGNNTLEQSTNNITYEQSKYNTTISINKINNTVYGNNITINGILTDTNNNRINNARIIITINGINQTTTTVNGVFNLNTKINKVGINNITVKYDGNNKYNSSTTNTTVNVSKLNSTINTTTMTGKLGNIVTLNATIKDSNNNPITNGKVVVKINDKTFGKVNITKDGKITYNLNLTPSQFGKKGYKITFVYGGSDITTETRINTKLNVIPFNPIINITTSTANINENTTMTVTIRNADGYNANSGTVGFKINGKTYKINGKAYIIKIKNGTVTFNFKVDGKLATHNNITITYSGNDKFNETKTEFTNKLNVNKQRKTIINTSITRTIIGENAVLTAKFTGANGQRLTSGKIAVKINGRTFGYTQIHNGTATYTLKLDPKKFSARNYTVTFKYGGSSTYTQAAANTTLTIVKHTTKFNYATTTARRNTTTRITVKITDNKNTVKADNGTLGLKINGKTYKVNDKSYIVKPVNGTATFTINTNNLQKNNNITFTYSGYREFTGLKQTYNNGLIIRT